MNNLWQDLRYSTRMLLKKPGFTLIAILTLALGIGANTAIFSVVNAVLLWPLPFRQPDHLIWLWGVQTQLAQAPISFADYLDWRKQTQMFEGIAAFAAYTSMNLSASDQPEQLRGAIIAADLFPLLGVKPALGRNFLPAEEQPGNHRVALISHSLWQRRFGSDPALVGRTITLIGRSYTVVGVMPPGFQFPILGAQFSLPVDVWTPLALTPEQTANRKTNFLSVIGRLKPDVTLEQAQAEMDTIASRLEQQYPETNIGDGVKLVPLHKHLVGDSRLTLFVLLGAVGFVLLIACANVANLLLARAAARQKEMAIRAALGASRLRVLRQLLTESLLLALLGGALGALLAVWGTDLLVALSPEHIPRLKEATLDLRVLGFTAVVSLLTGIIFGLAPAVQLSKPDLQESLKESSRGATAGAGRRRLPNLLAVSEVALALVLLIGAGLMIKSFLGLLRVDPGFDARNLLTMELSLPYSKYPEERQQAVFFRHVIERAAALPGVESAGGTSILPIGVGDSSTYFTVQGRPVPPPDRQPGASYRWVSPGYFRTTGIPFARGRDFSARDVEGAPKVVIINQQMAHRYWPGEDPVVQRITIRYGTGSFEREIVGVVGDIKHFGLDQQVQPEMYMPILEGPEQFMYLVVRGGGDPIGLAAAVRREVASLDRDQPVANIKTMDEYLSESLAPRRLSMLLIGVFAAIALSLAALGIYSVMAYSVAQRTREIGIRMALGARRSAVMKMVIGQGMRLASVGVVIGLAVSFALTRVMERMLFGVSATDPLTFTVIAAFLTVVALLACWIPARWATKVDPMIALRRE